MSLHPSHEMGETEIDGKTLPHCKSCGGIAEDLLDRACPGPPPKLEVHDHGDVISVQWSFPEGGVSKSTFPQPLVTVDHALDGRAIAATFVGPRAEELRDAFSLKLSEDEIKELKGAVRSGVKWVDVYKGDAYLNPSASRASRWLRQHAGIETNLNSRTGEVTFS